MAGCRAIPSSPTLQQLARRSCIALQRLDAEAQQKCLLTADVTEFAVFADPNTLCHDLIEIGPEIAHSLWSAAWIAGAARFKAAVLGWPAVTGLAGIVLAHCHAPSPA